MTNKNNFPSRLIIYGIFALFWCFYPGQSWLLTTANLNSQAFVQNKSIKFKPQLLPTLNYPFDHQLILADSYLVIDLASLTPIINYRANQKMYPASLVKLATAIVSYQHYPLEKNLIVNKTIDQELKMGLVRNEKISALNLLYGILVYSANDAAYTLAENYPGGVKKFVSAMNDLAQKLKMNNTRFANPIGFDSSNQFSTALDLAILSKEFISHQVLLNIASTKSITVSDADFEHFHYLNSINQLLGEIPHVGGLKTGTTDNAGENLISFYLFKQKPILFVVLKSQDRFTDTRNLIDFIDNHLSYQEII